VCPRNKSKVNDTDLHLFIEQMYMELEMQDFHLQGNLFPMRCPTRSREAMARDLVAIWQRKEMHLRACGGAARNGLCPFLHGQDDAHIDRGAGVFWRELKMYEEREQVMRDICDEFQRGNLPWSYETVRKLVRPFPKRGHMDVYRDGQEDEGCANVEEEMPWDDREGPSEDSGAETRPGRGAVLRARGETGAPPPAPSAPAVVDAIVPFEPDAETAGAKAAAEVANSIATQIARCQDLLEVAKTLRSRPLVRAIRSELRRLGKRARGPWRERAVVTMGFQREQDSKELELVAARKQAATLVCENRRLEQKRLKLVERGKVQAGPGEAERRPLGGLGRGE